MERYMLKYVVKCMGLVYVPMSICPVLLGATCALYHGGFSLLRTILCLIFAVAAQLTTNLAHHYFEMRKGKLPAVNDPDIALMDPHLSAKNVLKAAMTAMFIFSVTTGMALVTQTSMWMIPVGFIIFLIGYFYNSGPYPLGWNGWSEVLYFFIYGPASVTCTAYINIQQGLGSHIFYSEQFWEIIWMSVISGLMIVSVLLAHFFWTAPQDSVRGRRTLTVRCGRMASAWMFLVIGFLIFGAFYFTVYYAQTGLISGVPVPYWTMVIPACYLLVQIADFVLMLRLPEDKLWIPERVAVWNMFVMTVAMVVVAVVYGEDNMIIEQYI